MASIFSIPFRPSWDRMSGPQSTRRRSPASRKRAVRSRSSPSSIILWQIRHRQPCSGRPQALPVSKNMASICHSFRCWILRISEKKNCRESKSVYPAALSHSLQVIEDQFAVCQSPIPEHAPLSNKIDFDEIDGVDSKIIDGILDFQKEA